MSFLVFSRYFGGLLVFLRAANRLLSVRRMEITDNEKWIFKELDLLPPEHNSKDDSEYDNNEN